MTFYSHFFDMFLWMDDPHFGCKQKIPLKKTLGAHAIANNKG